jgi:oxygen-independent coproporphyrinogen-3 oxidase
MSDSKRAGAADKTKVGNYFVANYPPFSFWGPDHVPKVLEVLARPAPQDVALGLYVHIPFCRKRCDFCYFKVYTDKDSQAIRAYMDTVDQEFQSIARNPYIAGRKPRFVYFGGGTPSYLSAAQLRTLFERLQAVLPWDEAEEITFECEPGTLQESKIEALHELGVTRISLGVEHFDPQILEWNNRAHRGEEIFRAYDFCRKVGFEQINIDLIAGMVGETDELWDQCIDQTIRLDPQSVTIYQMEVPYNTTIYKRMRNGETEVAPVADWATKRRWTRDAFARLEAAGYEIGSAYTAKKDSAVSFQYRDALWTGADLLGLGVSSFGHLGGVHYQNEHTFDEYLAAVKERGHAILRALALSEEERLIREFVLLLKLGQVKASYFQEKFGVDVRERFREQLATHAADGYLTVRGDDIVLDRSGLLRVDQMLHSFFLPQHQNARYA